MTVVRILDLAYLFQDEDLVHHGTVLEELAPRVKFLLLRSVIERQRHMLQLHAGAVAIDGRLVLLPAQIGMGKTTLTARLVAAGAEYFSDEVVLIERGTELVRPVPVSLSIKPGSVDLLQAVFPALTDLPTHQRQDSVQVRYMPPPPGSVACRSLE